ncbi:MAG: peptide chain release factor N(5)-glutamine methyltransferase [Actinomycetota bacterium]|nr:peptide chain release factor N(5)-glutamine methyltransferase [Actinomycetota bacterium]
MRTELPRSAEVLREVTNRLQGHVNSPAAEARWLIESFLGIASWRVEDLVDPDALLSLDKAVARRVAGEPLQYIIGSQAFRGLHLGVGPGVLVPRPETETLVEIAIAKLADISEPLIVDLCTGSGAIALTIATEVEQARVYATEISEQAMHWARKNRDAYGTARLELLMGDLFEPLPRSHRGCFDLVVANPPYLSEEEIELVPVDVREHEPRVATVSGQEGNEVTNRIIEEAPDWLKPHGWLVIETSPRLAPAVARVASELFTEVDVHKDLTGAERIVAAGTWRAR